MAERFPGYRQLIEPLLPCCIFEQIGEILFEFPLRNKCGRSLLQNGCFCLAWCLPANRGNKAPGFFYYC
ncbi:hypothetical protein SAMN04488056_102470 [Cohaesibacter marisflavi]|uniref:Uncharacterized protein n=1 Tax=Cohaesibacter marisflavi TaxID=655353 RepID=A0A1I5D470_9HYPH|nr:hypothetical protein SAMN04488056_102470 [Cohaesibacter marisflavi]